MTVERALLPSAGEHAGKTCAICQSPLAAGEAVGLCPDCAAPFHAECWREIGGCATYGCAAMPESVKGDDPAAPATYWGQETKNCPRCGQGIKVAALRCRFCGAVFSTSDPVSKQEFRAGTQAPTRNQGLKTQAMAVFLAGVIPCTAPLGLLAGGIWFGARRGELKKASGLHHALALVGLIAAAITTVVLVGIFFLREN